jgi:hypothetical protein
VQRREGVIVTNRMVSKIPWELKLEASNEDLGRTLQFKKEEKFIDNHTQLQRLLWSRLSRWFPEHRVPSPLIQDEPLGETRQTVNFVGYSELCRVQVPRSGDCVW